MQSNIAIGSGGLMVKDYIKVLKTKKISYQYKIVTLYLLLLEKSLGVIGMVALIGLFAYFLYRMIKIAKNLKMNMEHWW